MWQTMTLKLYPEEIVCTNGTELRSKVLKENFGRKLLQVLGKNPLWYTIEIADWSTIHPDFMLQAWVSELVYKIVRRHYVRKPKHFQNNYC